MFFFRCLVFSEEKYPGVIFFVGGQIDFENSSDFAVVSASSSNQILAVFLIHPVVLNLFPASLLFEDSIFFQMIVHPSFRLLWAGEEDFLFSFSRKKTEFLNLSISPFSSGSVWMAESSYPRKNRLDS